MMAFPTPPIRGAFFLLPHRELFTRLSGGTFFFLPPCQGGVGGLPLWVSLSRGLPFRCQEAFSTAPRNEGSTRPGGASAPSTKVFSTAPYRRPFAFARHSGECRNPEPRRMATWRGARMAKASAFVEAYFAAESDRASGSATSPPSPSCTLSPRCSRRAMVAVWCLARWVGECAARKRVTAIRM